MKKLIIGQPQGITPTKNSKAFTLVELIIVITILAVLSTIAFISFRDYLSDARDANRVTSITNIRQALDLQKMKTRKYPTPSEAVSYTGGESEIKQGVINKEILSEMSTEPKDPSSEEYYTYSVSKNGKYYQIASQLENEVSYKSLIEKTYADDYESVKVVGNYRFDPSLPSLIVVPSSYTSGSGIFDPSVCFVMDEGENTLTTCKKPKSEMSLKDYDKSLVGYWDMETLTGVTESFSGYLADLSGNGNNGIFTGTVKPTGTGGHVGGGLYFSSGTIDCGSGEILYTKNKITIISIINAKTLARSRIVHRGSTTATDYLMGLDTSENFGVNYYSSGYYLNPHTRSNTIKGNTYYFLASTLDDGTARIFVNGAEFTDLYLGTINSNHDFLDLKNTGGKFYIGNTHNGTRQFDGIIDDIKIYNRVLSDDEILQQARMAGF